MAWYSPDESIPVDEEEYGGGSEGAQILGPQVVWNLKV